MWGHLGKGSTTAVSLNQLAAQIGGALIFRVGLRLVADYDKLVPRAGTDDKEEVQANRFGAAKQ
jgi:hypothetical protein